MYCVRNRTNSLAHPSLSLTLRFIFSPSPHSVFCRPARLASVTTRAYKVNLKTIDGAVTTLEVGEDQSILEVALDNGMALTSIDMRSNALDLSLALRATRYARLPGMEGLPHDCKVRTNSLTDVHSTYLSLAQHT